MADPLIPALTLMGQLGLPTVQIMEPRREATPSKEGTPSTQGGCCSSRLFATDFLKGFLMVLQGFGRVRRIQQLGIEFRIGII